MSNKTQGWKCTDKSTLQYGRKISDKKFEYKEFDLGLFNPSTAGTMKYIQEREKMNEDSFVDKYWDEPSLWFNEEVDLEDYDLEEIQEIVESFGLDYDGEFITEQSGEFYEDNAKVAEMIFEYETQY